MFPAMSLSLSGLELSQQYSVSLKVSPADTLRYRFIDFSWQPTGEAGAYEDMDKQVYIHPSSPNSGKFWMQNFISFKKVKITNYEDSKNGNVLFIFNSISADLI